VRPTSATTQLAGSPCVRRIPETTISSPWPPLPYKRRKQALKADIDEEAWATLNRTESRPFPKPETGKVAVKVINDYGDEVVKVLAV
jgi:hypothetical protein